jgi:hypothetical protein
LEAKGADGWEGIRDATEIVALCLAVAVEVRKTLGEATERKIATIWFGRL